MFLVLSRQQLYGCKSVFFFLFFLFSGGLVLSRANDGPAPFTLSPQDQIDFGDYMGMSCYI